MLGRIFGLPVMMRSTPSISDSLGRRTTNCSQSHGARNESSLLPTWTIRASLHCSKPTVPASSYSAEARTLTERCLRCSTGSWPAPPHSASVARGHWAPRGGRNPSSMITLLLSLPLRRLSSARPREPSLAPAVRRVQENGDPAETAHDRSALLAHVGDSDVDDVKGARAAGLRVAWVNRDRRSHHPDVPQPDFEIPDLTELLTPL